jgi:hypothetical protein
MCIPSSLPVSVGLTCFESVGIECCPQQPRHGLASVGSPGGDSSELFLSCDFYLGCQSLV